MRLLRRALSSDPRRRRGQQAARASEDESEAPARETLWAICGLGNPGARYSKNRHNIGVMVLELLGERAGASLSRDKSGCLAATARIGAQRAILARPATYMNESGRPVRALLDYYKVVPERLVVIHDELDIPFGDVRVKRGGGTAGHNGLASLVAHIGTGDFVRVRCGIGRPRGQTDPADFVLQDFSPAERKALPGMIDAAADAAERIVEVGAERAMNEVNTRAREER